MARFTCNMISYVLGRAIDLSIVVPTHCYGAITAYRQGENPTHAPQAPYPVLYLLHGHGNNHATWTGYANVEFFAEEHQIAVVMLSAENKGYVNHLSGDNFFDFISVELPEFVKAMFPISDRPEDTYIAGLSMGGGGSWIHALNNPEKYAAFGSFSGGVIPSPVKPGEEPDPRFDPWLAAEKLVQDGKQFPKAYIACGTRDFLYETNQKLRDKLIELGADVTWDESDHEHEWRFWNIQIEKFLEWIPRTDFYAGKKRKI